jgi:hypothetical protein
MTDSYAKNLLAVRGRRCVATLLTYLEDHAWEHLTEETRHQIRSKVMSTIGEFQDLAMDMVAADTGSINQFWVDELEKLHDRIRELKREHGRPVPSRN